MYIVSGYRRKSLTAAQHSVPTSTVSNGASVQGSSQQRLSGQCLRHATQPLPQRILSRRGM